jgi:hypothetical protein
LTHPELKPPASVASRYTFFAPKKGVLNSTCRVNCTEFAATAALVKPTAHWLFCRFAEEPRPLIAKFTPSSPYRLTVFRVRFKTT